MDGQESPYGFVTLGLKPVLEFGICLLTLANSALGRWVVAAQDGAA